MTPICLWLWKKSNDKKILILITLCIALEFLLAAVCGNCSFSHWVLYVFPISRFLDFLIGGGYYWIAKKYYNCINENLRVYSAVVGFFFILLCIFAFFTNSDYYYSAIWSMISPCAVSLFYVGDQVITRYLPRFVICFGDMSFEFFMMHQLCIKYVTWMLKKCKITNGIVISACCFMITLLAIIIWRKMCDCYMKRRNRN